MGPKGKGKAAPPPASSSGTSSKTASSTTTTSTTTSAPARRVPIGKVIHTWVDTMSNDVQQGYDGQKFQQAYQDLVLKPTQDASLSSSQNKPAGSISENADAIPYPPEELDMFIKLTGLSREEAKDIFAQAGGDVTKACKAYLKPNVPSRALVASQ